MVENQRRHDGRVVQRQVAVSGRDQRQPARGVVRRSIEVLRDASGPTQWHCFRRTGRLPVRYTVGTPKGRLTRLGQAFAGLPWRGARESVEVKLLPEDGEPYVMARSRPRIGKERGMRRRRLKKLWRRLHEVRGQSLKRDDLLLKLGSPEIS